MRHPIYLRTTASFETACPPSELLNMLADRSGSTSWTLWSAIVRAVPAAGNGRALRAALRAAFVTGNRFAGVRIGREEIEGGEMLRLRASEPAGAALLFELRAYPVLSGAYYTLDLTAALDAGLAGKLLQPLYQAQLRRVAKHWQHRLQARCRTLREGAHTAAGTGQPLDSADLEQTYPLTVKAFREMPGGLEALQRVVRMNAHWRSLVRGDIPQHAVVERYGALPQPEAVYDIVYCGGGLGLVSAATMATRYGRKVLVFDRYTPGKTHREWNICEWELHNLVRSGILTSAEMDSIVAARYRTGIIEFFDSNSPWKDAQLWVDNVLDLAVEADALLTLCAEKVRHSGTGSHVAAGQSFVRVHVPAAPLPESEPVKAVVETLDAGGNSHFYGARLVVDAMGAGSPLSYTLSKGRPYAGVCPTVGTVARGFVEGTARNEVDYSLGEILISTADIVQNRQLIWEGFPAGGGAMTVYLFYYNALEPGKRADPGDLLQLFEQYFELLPTYKSPGTDFQHLKPVYGFIPSRARETPSESGATRAARSIIALGDSSAQQSPLTFCGFGSYVRNLERTTGLMDYALRHNLLEANDLRLIGAQQANVTLNWVFSRFMEPRRNSAVRPNEVNEMMTLICTVIAEMGPGFAQRFFKDRAGFPELNLMLFKIVQKYGGIWDRAFTTVGFRGLALWLLDYFAFFREWLFGLLYRTTYRQLPVHLQQRIAATLERRMPAVWMRILARTYAWEAADEVLEPVIVGEADALMREPQQRVRAGTAANEG